MAHGIKVKTLKPSGIGSRRIFTPDFKLQVLDSYRNDADCKGNQRATARKYGIHRRQIQKWLQVYNTLRNSVKKEINNNMVKGAASPPPSSDYTTLAPMDLSCKKASAPASAAHFPLPPVTVTSPPSLLVQPHPDVWDLSTKRAPSPKPVTVKLFKPYLDEVDDSSPTCSSHCDSSEYTITELHPYYYEMFAVDEPKPRQSYSLDFKLRAIDSYYSDAVCKGNQRAVATKYNIHRRQVQKWLKQADELRLRNESVNIKLEIKEEMHVS